MPTDNNHGLSKSLKNKDYSITINGTPALHSVMLHIANLLTSPGSAQAKLAGNVVNPIVNWYRFAKTVFSAIVPESTGHTRMCTKVVSADWSCCVGVHRCQTYLVLFAVHQDLHYCQ